MSVVGFKDILHGPFATYLNCSQQIGGDVASQSTIVEKAFQAQLQYLIIASQSKAPKNTLDQIALLQATRENIYAIQEFREKNRSSQYFNHLSAISESISALGWVTVSQSPSLYVKEMNDAGQFYTNRVLTDWKQNFKHSNWVKAWIQTLSKLQAFVEHHHTTGLVWSGSNVPHANRVSPSPSGCSVPPTNMQEDISALDLGNNLLSFSSQLGDISATSTSTKKSPVFIREGKKWKIEYQEDNRNLIVENTEMNNVVYVFKCINSTVSVKGKINSLILDSCKKTCLFFDSVVSSVEIINCQSMQLQVFGKVPTILIDKTDGCQMYLNQESLDVELISSKSSELNVLVPKENGDYSEYPVPEQYKTVVTNSGLITTAIEFKD